MNSIGRQINNSQTDLNINKVNNGIIQSGTDITLHNIDNVIFRVLDIKNIDATILNDKIINIDNKYTLSPKYNYLVRYTLKSGELISTWIYPSEINHIL